MNELKVNKNTFETIKHIADMGGIMPEDLPTPDKSLKELKNISNNDNLLNKE